MLSLCWSSRTVITECSHLLLSLFCLSCFPHRDAEESVPMAAEPGLPACNACASRTDGTCMTINISINSTLSLIYQFIFCFLKYYFVIVSCVCRWCVCWWSVSTCWSCCWMKQPCPEEWRWSFCQNRINKCALFKGLCATASRDDILRIVIFVCCRTLTLGWPPFQCLAHWVLLFK